MYDYDRRASTEITWNTTDLPKDRIEGILGKDIVHKILALPKAQGVAHATSRAKGNWDANERESYAAYRSLAKLIDPHAKV